MRKSLSKVMISSVLCASMVVGTAMSVMADTHTTQDVINKMNELTYETKSGVEYTEQPSTENPYVAGKISSNSLNNGLTSLNLMRYVAGLDSVILDDDYNNTVQHTAVLMGAIDDLSHYAAKPADMEDDFYAIAHAGAMESNLFFGGGANYNLADSIITYANDYSSKELGHRRWILNPVMGKTGFGLATNSAQHVYSSMYAFDRTNNSSTADVEYVAWPSENMPYSLYEEILNSDFNHKFTFSLEFGNQKTGDEYDDVDINKVSVKITKVVNGIPNASTTKIINAANSSTSGNYLYVDNDSYDYNYGMSHCVMFEFGKCAKNDIYNIEISGITKAGVDSPINYTVSLFDDKSTISDAKAQVLSNYKDTETTTMRVLASIHSINLEDVGFVFSLKNENPTLGGENCKELSTNKVYTSIKASGRTISAYDLSGTYIATCLITNIPQSNYDTPIYIRSYAKKNGTYIYGNTKAYKVNN